jgi:hypothetical protein
MLDGDNTHSHAANSLLEMQKLNAKKQYNFEHLKENISSSASLALHEQGGQGGGDRGGSGDVAGVAAAKTGAGVQTGANRHGRRRCCACCCSSEFKGAWHITEASVFALKSPWFYSYTFGSRSFSLWLFYRLVLISLAVGATAPDSALGPGQEAAAFVAVDTQLFAAAGVDILDIVLIWATNPYVSRSRQLSEGVSARAMSLVGFLLPVSRLRVAELILEASGVGTPSADQLVEMRGVVWLVTMSLQAATILLAVLPCTLMQSVLAIKLSVQE